MRLGNPLVGLAGWWAQADDRLTMLLEGLARQLDQSGGADQAADDEPIGYAIDETAGGWPQLSLVDLAQAGDVVEEHALDALVDLAAELAPVDRSELLTRAVRLFRQFGSRWMRAAAQFVDRQLSQRVDRAVGEDRRHLARELHDRLGYAVALAFLKLELHHRESGSGKPENRHLAAVREALQLAADLVGNVVFRLRVESVPRSLAVAIQDCVDALNVDGTPVQVLVRGDCARIPAQYRDELLLVIREFLRNSFAHAEAREIWVSVEIGADWVALTAADDGRGFNAESGMTDRPARGFGLSAMRERVERLAGRFTLATSVGGGTRVNASIPLPEQRDSLTSRRLVASAAC